MIQGEVNSMREAIVRMTARAPGDRVVEVDAIVDTGFNDQLTLPSELIAALALTPECPAEVTLADNVVVQTNCYRVIVDWDGRPRVLSVLEIEGGPLREWERCGGAD